MAANFYEILPNMQPTVEDVARAELFAQQYLQSQFPDTDFREGTAIRDLTIRPTASLLALIKKGLDYYFTTYTINGANNLTPEATVDDIMSNLFIYRKQGLKSTITARLYFAIRKTVVISQGLFFSPDNKVKFFPRETKVYPETDLSYDSAENEYYIDISMNSEKEGEEYNIDSGSLLYFTNFDPYFLRGEILFLNSKSSPKETNNEFLDRAETAISTRNLINDNSIVYRMNEAFPSVSAVTSVGYGHPEMLRDAKMIVTPTSGALMVHLGGKVDVYCLTDLTQSTDQYTTDENGWIRFEGPVLAIERVSEEVATENEDEIPLIAPSAMEIENYPGGVLSDYELDSALSAKQITYYKFGNTYPNSRVTLTVFKYDLLDSVQSYLEARENRVVCGDYLARAFNTYYLTIHLDDHSAVNLDRVKLEEYTKLYLRSLRPSDPFIVADWIAKLYESGVKSLKNPPSITYTYYKRDLSQTDGEILDYLQPSDTTSVFVLRQLTVE